MTKPDPIQAPPDQPNVATDPVPDIDPFDNLEALRLSPEAASVGTRKVITRDPVRKPGNQEFFRVHPDEQYRFDAAIIELRDDRETYIVDGRLREELAGEARAVRLYTWVSRAGAVALWPIRLPGPDGRRNGWHDSAHAAAELAMTNWTRIDADMAAGQYNTLVAAAKIPDPEWPEPTFNELLKLAFKDAIINSVDHPVVERLRGLR